MAKAIKKPQQPLTAADLRALLRTRCAPPAWAIFEEVHNGTGGSHRRSADAVAMTIWPSRGLEVHGFEIKVSRRDWVSERDRPEKADAIGKYCDRWWLVVSDDRVVLNLSELPSGWGLLVARGGKLIQAIEAPLLKPEALDRAFLAAMLRRAHERLKDMVPREDVAAEINASYSKGFERGKEHRSDDLEVAALYKSVEEFEAKSGIKISAYDGARLGEAFHAFMAGGRQVETVHGRLEFIARQAKGIYEAADAAAKAIADTKGAE